jgi:hypothetical protein
MRLMSMRPALAAVCALLSVVVVQLPAVAKVSPQDDEAVRVAVSAGRSEVVEQGRWIDVARREPRKRASAIRRQHRTVLPAVNDPTLNRLLDNKRPIEIERR